MLHGSIYGKNSEEIEQILQPPGIKHGLLENPAFIHIYIGLYRMFMDVPCETSIKREVPS
jgi:hypothetical protein